MERKAAFSKYHESMAHNTKNLCIEYGIPYDDAWCLMDDIALENDIDMSYGQSVVWCMLEAEKRLEAEYGKPYYWK